MLSGSVARAEPMDTNEQASVRGEIDKFIASFPRKYFVLRGKVTTLGSTFDIQIKPFIIFAVLCRSV